MSNYVFQTTLSVEESIERFHDSIDHGVFSKRRHHPEYEFEGNVQGEKFWLRRRGFVQQGTIPVRVSMGERMLVGSFAERGDGTTINTRFRFPWFVILQTIFLALPISAGGCLLLAAIASLLGTDVFTPPFDTQTRLLVLAVGSLFTLVPLLFALFVHIVARRIERENKPKMIAFIQRTFDADLIKPSPITGVTDVR